MTPLERVARLRDQLTDIPPAPWRLETGGFFGIAALTIPTEATGRHTNRARRKYRRFVINTPNNATAQHLHRWQPDTATTVYDLLALTLTQHEPDEHDRCLFCALDTWCPPYIHALEVLDHLDPEGADQ